MRNKKEMAFTLIEVLTVVVIIAILVAIALPSYVAMKEKEHDREAGASMRLIMAAQKIYRMETSVYDVENSGAAATDIANINSVLRLSIPNDNATRIWDYRTVADNVADPQTTCVEATRTGIGLPGGDSRIGRNLRMRNTESEEISGTCP